MLRAMRRQWFRIVATIAVVAVASTTVGSAASAADPGGSITGTVTDARDGALRLPSQLRIKVVDEAGEFAAELGQILADGKYVIEGLSTGTYRLQVLDQTYWYFGEYFGGARTIEGATEIEVVDGQVTEQIDIELDVSVVLTGQFVGEGGAAINPGSMIIASVYDEFGTELPGQSTNDEDRFNVADLPAGRYRLAFHDVGCLYETSYFQGQGGFVSSTLVDVVPGQTRDLGPIELPVAAGECAPDELPEPVVVSTSGSTLTATWQPAVADVQPAVTGYTVTSLPAGAGCATDGAASCVINGAIADTDYRFFVSATNSAGTSLPSRPSAVVQRPADPAVIVVAPPRELATQSQSVKRHPARIGVGRTKTLPARTAAGVKVRWTSLTPGKCVVRKGKLVGRGAGKCKVRAIAKAKGTWLRYEKTAVVRVRR